MPKIFQDPHCATQRKVKISVGNLIQIVEVACCLTRWSILAVELAGKKSPNLGKNSPKGTKYIDVLDPNGNFIDSPSMCQFKAQATIKLPVIEEN